MKKRVKFLCNFDNSSEVSFFTTSSENKIHRYSKYCAYKKQQFQQTNKYVCCIVTLQVMIVFNMYVEGESHSFFLSRTLQVEFMLYLMNL